jgi:hypothetical protein
LAAGHGRSNPLTSSGSTPGSRHSLLYARTLVNPRASLAFELDDRSVTRLTDRLQMDSEPVWSTH